MVKIVERPVTGHLLLGPAACYARSKKSAAESDGRAWKIFERFIDGSCGEVSLRKRISPFRIGPLLGIMILGGSAVSASAQTCNVPGNLPTIQSAVNSAQCSTIAIGPGTFEEEVTVNRSLTMVGAGQDLTTITGQVRVTGFGVDVLISDLSVDTTVPGSAGCYDDAMRVVAGANARAINVRAINATGSGPCLIPLFADGFETGDTSRWSNSVGAT